MDTHHAQMRETKASLKTTIGDWVEKLHALVEYYDARLELIDWAE